MPDEPESSAARSLPWKDALPPILLCAFLLGAGLVSGFLQEEPDTDETVYLAMAEAWAKEGISPYSDFFHAHPPGLIAPATLLFAVVPPSIRAARLVPLLGTVALFLLTLACARKLEPNGFTGAPLFAGTLLVVSPLIHLVGATYLGLNVPAALCMASILLTLRGRPGAAGTVLGLAFNFRLSALPVLAVLAFSHRRRPRFFIGLGAGLLPLILCWILWPHCFSQTVVFHWDKQAMLFGERLAVIGRFLYEEKFLLVLAVPALFRLRDPLTRLFLAAGLATLLFAVVQKVVWPHYFHMAVPLLAVPSAAWVGAFLRPHLAGKALLLPNLGLLLVAGVLNAFIISPRYSDDPSLLPLVDKARVLAGAGGKVLDLSGGGKACYLACKTDLKVEGFLFDMSIQRYVQGDLDGKILASHLESTPDLVLTEMEARGKTVLWSRLPDVRAALLGRDSEGGGYRPADVFLRPNDFSLILLWVPASRGDPEPPPDSLDEGTRKWRFWYVRSDAKRRSAEAFLEGDFRIGTEEVWESVRRLTAGPGALVARGAFVPPDGAVRRWLAEDEREGRPVTSFVWTQPVGGSLRIETVYAGRTYEPLSFCEARFDLSTGELAFLRVYGEVGRGFVPVLTIRPSEPVDTNERPQ